MAITFETTKTCIECGETKALEEFSLVGPDRSRRYTRCSTCLLSTRSVTQPFRSKVDERERLVDVEDIDVHHSSSFVGELEVVDACWSNCVEVGAAGIRRIIDRLDMAAADLAGDPDAREKIRNLVREYRAGTLQIRQAHRVVKAVLVGLQA